MIMLIVTLSQKTEDFQNGAYLGLAIGGAILIYIISRRYFKRR